MSDDKNKQELNKSQKQAGLNMGTCIAIGIGFGSAIGVSMDKLAIGVAIGVAIGAAMGGAFHSYSQKEKQNDK